MKFFQAVVLLLFAADFSTADDVKPPTYPAPGVDLVLTGGKSAKEFFASRAADADCRAALAEAKAAYEADQAKLDAMTQSREARDALDAQERALEDSRYAYLVKMEECGPCATDDVKSVKIQSSGRTQYWYVLDGSYLIEAANESQRKQKVQRLKTFLLTVPAKKKELLRNLIEYRLVDNATGEMLEGVQVIKQSPFYTFTSIGRPVLGSVFACDFYSKGVLETSNGLVLKSEVVPRPKTFSPPLTDYVSPSGKTYYTRHEPVRSGLGMTYLNSDGYLRMWSATDYGIDMSAARSMMRRAHLDLLAQLDAVLEREGSK
jgi:hypothetical protein